MLAITTCSGEDCGAAIAFVLTEENARMPINMDPTAGRPVTSMDGTLVPAIDEAGRYVQRFGVPVVHVLTGAERPPLEPALVAHWTTCPADARFRNRRRRLAKRCAGCGEPLAASLVERGELYHVTCEPGPGPDRPPPRRPVPQPPLPGVDRR